MMQLDRFTAADIPAFLALADQEGWICSPAEFAFLLRVFPAGCCTVRREGIPVAFITSIRYGTSGWIGNLIVDPGLRGQGVGRQLMEAALAALQQAGTKSVWLTASQQGAPLYARLGFVTVDTIRRWQGMGAVAPAPADKLSQSSYRKMVSIDRHGWGDRRASILCDSLVAGDCRSLDNGFIVTRPAPDGIQIGPWSALTADTATRLLDASYSPDPSASPVVLDLPEGNRHATDLLGRSGFSTIGSTLLMCRGTLPPFHPETIYALASMGSMG